MEEISKEDVEEVKRLLSKGIKHKEIASSFGVGRGAISDISNSRNWGFINE
ncbi:MAG: helix-turn-helix domain-containing protein [Halopenitus sp.]